MVPPRPAPGRRHAWPKEAIPGDGSREFTGAATARTTHLPSGADGGQLDQTYAIDVGNAILDLSKVDFSGGSYTVTAENQIGNLTVIVPATVDVRGC